MRMNRRAGLIGGGAGKVTVTLGGTQWANNAWYVSCPGSAGTRYFTAGASFEAQAGDTVYCYCRSSDTYTSRITLNGATAASGAKNKVSEYSLAPTGDAEITCVKKTSAETFLMSITM